MKVIAGDIDRGATARYVADYFELMPPTVDGERDAILQMCQRLGVSVVVPTRDGELAFWARHAEWFRAEGVHVIVSEPEAVAVSVDKLEFARHGTERGLPMIPTSTLPEGRGRFVVKERYGAGSRLIGIDLDKEAAVAHAASLTHPVFQPFIRGKEVSVDAWIDRNHRVKGVVLRTRDRVVDGESVVTTTFRDPDLEALCRRVFESMCLRGPVVLQLLLDAENRPHVIELNARFGGASTAAIAAGLDSWHWSLAETDGVEAEELPFRRIPGEIRQIRLPSDVIVHDPDL